MDNSSGDKLSPDSTASLSPEVTRELQSPVRLAEFSSLRTEMDRRANVQWNVFALQITSAGAIAGVAITSTSNYAILLLIPFSSYMLGGRYILHDFHLKLIQKYIDDFLSPQLGGELGWGIWKARITSRTQPSPWRGVVTWDAVHPTRLAFEGVALLASVGAAAAVIYVWTSKSPGWYTASGFAVVWIVGLALIFLLHRSFNRATPAWL